MTNLIIQIWNSCTILVPVVLGTEDHSLGAVGFSIDYDQVCLNFDQTDGPDADDLPDALTGWPAGFSPSVSFSAGDPDGELDISLTDMTAPIEALPAGALVNITFDVLSVCEPIDGSAALIDVNFSDAPPPSFGSTTGSSVSGEATGATIPVTFSQAPTGITLTPNSIPENEPPGTVVGTLSTADPNLGDTHTYSVVAGVGDDTDFAVAGDQLQALSTFDYELKNSYSVRIRTEDLSGLTYEETLAIQVTNVNEPPTALDDAVDPEDQVFVGPGGPINVLANDTDPDADTTLIVSAVGLPNAGVASTDGATVTYDPPEDDNGIAAFSYTASDGYLTDDANVWAVYVANDARGDCNSDSTVDAGDFVAEVLELFDEPMDAPWYAIWVEGFPGSPQGCDSNIDKVVEISDVICTVRLYFGDTCGGGMASAAASSQPPELTVKLNSAKETAKAKIGLEDGSIATAGVAFRLRYDPEQVRIDPTDQNEDGIPDAVDLYVPKGVQVWAEVDNTAGQLKLAVADVAMPISPLPTGKLLEVRFARVGTGDVKLAIWNLSFSTPEGEALPIMVSGDAVLERDWIYLPVMTR